ncbi:MAG: glycine zipper 2TM domain-containing protein [Gammaproteobacteria bacterium]
MFRTGVYVIGLTAAATLLVAGCANMGPNPYGATTYGGSATRTEQQVSYGTVVSLAAAQITPGQTENAVATGVGAVAGGIAGSAAGGGRGQALTTLAGAVLGGLAGNAIDKKAGTAQAVTITVKLDDGKTVAITQGVDPNVIFKVGERVQILRNPSDGTARVLALQQ